MAILCGSAFEMDEIRVFLKEILRFFRIIHSYYHILSNAENRGIHESFAIKTEHFLSFLNTCYNTRVQLRTLKLILTN